jgi:hypothetical protein
MECLDSVKNASFFTFFKTKSEFAFFLKENKFRFCFEKCEKKLTSKMVEMLWNCGLWKDVC